MRFFISISWRKVSHDLSVEVFTIYWALQWKKKMFLRYTFKVLDVDMMHFSFLPKMHHLQYYDHFYSDITSG